MSELDPEELARMVADGAQAARRAYPPGLEDELDEHWRRVAHRPRNTEVVRLHEQMDRYVETASFRVPITDATSSRPGGAAIHKVVGKTVTRHLQDLVLQLDEYSRSVQDMFTAILAVFDAGPIDAHTHHDLISHLESLEGRMAELVRAANAAAAADDGD